MNLRNCILMNKVIFILIILLLVPSFAYREPHYCKIVDCITKSYLKEIAEPRGLILSGYGGAMMNDIQSITLRFFSSDALNVNEARILYIEMMEEFLRRINCHEKIRPHLHNFPFEADNIELTISFLDSQGHTTSDGHIAMVFISKNHTLYFEAYNPTANDFYTLCKEPYIEARKIVIEGPFNSEAAIPAGALDRRGLDSSVSSERARTSDEAFDFDGPDETLTAESSTTYSNLSGCNEDGMSDSEVHPLTDCSVNAHGFLETAYAEEIARKGNEFKKLYFDD